MNSNTIGSIALVGFIGLFVANVFMNDITGKSVGDMYVYMKTDFPIYGDREIIFMDKGDEFEVKGLMVPFSWTVNGESLSGKKGVYFLSKNKFMPYDILSSPQKEMYNQAVYYLENDEVEKATIPLLGLNASL